MPVVHVDTLTARAIWPHGSEPTAQTVTAVALPPPTTEAERRSLEQALVAAVTDPALPPIGRVIVRNPDAPKVRWRWDGETAGGEIVRLDAASARLAGWALYRAFMAARVAASRAA